MPGDVDHSAIAQTAAFLQGLAPRTVYFTLRGEATEATLEGVTIVENQSFRIRPRIRFGDELFDNPCAVGKAMHQYLCQTHNFDNRPPKTFDGWNKLKVVIGNGIYRLEHLLPSGARKGTLAMTKLPPLGQDKRKHDLKSILDLPSSTHITRPTEVQRPSRKRKRRPNDADLLPPPPPPEEDSIELPALIDEQDFFPYMTMLSEHFRTTNTRTIIQRAMGLGGRAWEKIAGMRPWWVAGS